MPLDEGLEEVVSIMTNYYLEDGQKYLVEQYGDQAPSLAGEMADMLEELFNSDTPYGQLWAEYRQDPLPNEAEVIGALEVLEEAMPEVTIRLEGYYAAFQEMTQEGRQDVMETAVPEDTVNIEEIENIKSYDDFDDDDEYMEENTYLVGNVEDRSTSALYIEGLDTSIEPNQSETDDDYAEDQQTDE